MLSKKFIEERKKDLLEQKKRLEQELSRLASKDNDNYRPKFPLLGDKDEDNELEVSEFDQNVDAEKRLENMLKETNEALNRIKKGAYGFCENCSQEIDKARLKAYPAATTCIKCE